MDDQSWTEYVRKAGNREHDDQAYCVPQHIPTSGSGTCHSIFSRDLKILCIEAIEKAGVQRVKHPGRPFYQNEPELKRLALKQMKDLGLRAIPNDKDSDFVLIKLSDVYVFHEEILQGKELLLNSSRIGMERVTAQVQTNLKTHKPPGQIKSRAINPATKKSVVSLDKYMTWKLRNVLTHENHMLNAVEQFHTTDVENFFTIDDHWYLTRMIASISESKDRNLMQKVVLFFYSEISSWPTHWANRFFSKWKKIRTSDFCKWRTNWMMEEVIRESHINVYFRYGNDIFSITIDDNDNDNDILGTLAKHWKYVAVMYKSPCESADITE